MIDKSPLLAQANSSGRLARNCPVRLNSGEMQFFRMNGKDPEMATNGVLPNMTPQTDYNLLFYNKIRRVHHNLL